MTGTPDEQAGGSGRHRGHGRHRRGRSHRHRRNWLFGGKDKDSNFIAAICNMIVVVLLCTALAEPQWFYVHGGSCHDQHDRTIDYIGMHMFLTHGSFESGASAGDSDIVTTYIYGSSQEKSLVNCVTKDIVYIIHSILAFCFLAILMSIVAFLFELSAPQHKVLKTIRENSLFSIASVLLCVVISGFCYWATEHFEELLSVTKAHKTSKVEVEFSISFYLVTVAGSVSVIATACNLIKCPGTRRPSTRYQQLRNSYEDELEDLAEESPSFVAHRQPPPYQP